MNFDENYIISKISNDMKDELYAKVDGKLWRSDTGRVYYSRKADLINALQRTVRRATYQYLCDINANSSYSMMRSFWTDSESNKTKILSELLNSGRIEICKV